MQAAVAIKCNFSNPNSSPVKRCNLSGPFDLEDNLTLNDGPRSYTVVPQFGQRKQQA